MFAENIHNCINQVAYEASMREAERLLQEHASKLQKGQCTKDGAFDEDQHRIVGGRVGLLLQRMSNELTRECERLGAWGVLGQGTGGRLVKPGSKEAMPREQLVCE